VSLPRRWLGQDQPPQPTIVIFIKPPNWISAHIMLPEGDCVIAVAGHDIVIPAEHTKVIVWPAAADHWSVNGQRRDEPEWRSISAPTGRIVFGGGGGDPDGQIGPTLGGNGRTAT
jgi:hypothetical protein